MNINLTEFTDEELVLLRQAVTAEQENRDKLADLPRQVESLSRMYLDLGGSASALTDAVSAASEPEVTS